MEKCIAFRDDDLLARGIVDCRPCWTCKLGKHVESCNMITCNWLDCLVDAPSLHINHQSNFVMLYFKVLLIHLRSECFVDVGSNFWGEISLGSTAAERAGTVA